MTVFAGARKRKEVTQPLASMTAAQLRALAKKRGVDVPPKATKAKLIELLG